MDKIKFLCEFEMLSNVIDVICVKIGMRARQHHNNDSHFLYFVCFAATAFSLFGAERNKINTNATSFCKLQLIKIKLLPREKIRQLFLFYLLLILCIIVAHWNVSTANFHAYNQFFVSVLARCLMYTRRSMSLNTFIYGSYTAVCKKFIHNSLERKRLCNKLDIEMFSAYGLQLKLQFISTNKMN